MNDNTVACILMQPCVDGRSWSVHTGGMSDLHHVPSCKGRLLVATPPLGDPNFDRTVVYMLEHTAAGAIGVVLNRPLEEECPASLDAWSHLLCAPAVLFGGGPVDLDALIGVARADQPGDTGWHIVADEGGAAIGSVDLAASPHDVGGRITAMRLFRGYSGWAPSQLDGELGAQVWMVFDAIADDIFTAAPHDLWRRVVRRQGGRVAWAADAPDDLSNN